MRDLRSHVLVLREPSAGRRGYHPQWQLYLYESLARFDRNFTAKTSTARYWSYKPWTSHAILHFVACRNMPRCLEWFEYSYRYSTCANVADGESLLWEPCTRPSSNASQPYRCDRYMQPPRTIYPDS